MGNAPFALIRRWTQSSTPVDTCVCATTAGWSWRDRSMPAVQYAGGLSKMLSKHIGHDEPKCLDRCYVFHCWMPPVFHSQACLEKSWPQLEISQTWTWLCLSFILSAISGETAVGRFNTKAAYMSFILAKKETFVLPFCMWCLLCHMYLLSRNATCIYFCLFTLIVLDLCVLQQNIPPVVNDF